MKGSDTEVVKSADAGAYISVFSGIGGLEHPYICPKLFCEIDRGCQKVLQSRYALPEGAIHSDVTNLTSPTSASFVVGGWPCQDISSAGRQFGISGTRSGLFYEMLRIAVSSGAHTIVGENVPNLLKLHGGRDFDVVKTALMEAGFPFISWRTLNARQFGLPQNRNRLFIVASKKSALAEALHAKIPSHENNNGSFNVHGFYWTGGKRSLCFSTGYVPALKVGATDNRGRGTVAIFDGITVRKLTAGENLRLQGFPDLKVPGLPVSTLLRMTGNAVALPVGRFVVSSVMEGASAGGIKTGFARLCPSGFFDGNTEWEIHHGPGALATNLSWFLDSGVNERLSAQACAGLIVRSVRGKTKMPSELFDALYKNTLHRKGKLSPSRANSFEAMDNTLSEIIEYRNGLKPISQFIDNKNE